MKSIKKLKSKKNQVNKLDKEDTQKIKGGKSVFQGDDFLTITDIKASSSFIMQTIRT